MDYPKSMPGVGLVNSRFVDENPITGTPGSLIPAEWGNALTEEVLTVIKAAGIEPTEGLNTQLLDMDSREQIDGKARKSLRHQRAARPQHRDPQRRIGITPDVEGRVHHHGIQRGGRFPRGGIGPMELRARVGEVDAGAVQRVRLGLDHMQITDGGVLQNCSGQIAPACAQIGNAAFQIGQSGHEQG